MTEDQIRARIARDMATLMLTAPENVTEAQKFVDIYHNLPTVEEINYADLDVPQ